MKLVYNSAQKFKNLIELCHNLVEEGTFTINEKGFQFMALDPSHVAMVSLDLPKEQFETWEGVEEEKKIGIRLDEFKKILGRAGKNDSITLDILQSMWLEIYIGQTKFSMRLIDSTSGSSPLPKLTHNAKVVINSQQFFDLVDSVECMSDYIIMNAIGNNLYLKGKGDSGDVEVKVEKEKLGTLDVNEESLSTYSVEYLKMVKPLTKYCDTLQLEFSTKMPLKVTAPYIEFYLAPRVTD